MDHLEKFKSAIEPYREAWKSVDVRVVCFLAYNKWINLGTRLILCEKPATGLIHLGSFPGVAGLSAFREVHDIGELDGLLMQVQEGKLIVAGNEVHIGRIENNEVKGGTSSFWFHTNRRPSDLVFEGLNFPTIVVRQGGEQIHNLLHNHPEALGKEELDWKLRSLEVPYDGLDDLLVSFLGLPKPAWGRVTESTFADVIAPIRVRLGEECNLSKGKVRVQVEAFAYERLDGVSLGILALSGTSPLSRSSHDLSATDWAREANRLVANKEVDVGDASSVVIFLRFRGGALERLVASDPSALLRNPRILAYSHFDENLTVLRGYLEGKGSDRSGDFEIGVGLLLHLFGLNVGPYGRVKRLQEGIDLIAFVPSRTDIILAECTTGDLDANGKLSKLSRRVKVLQGRLAGQTVTPVIFTALESAKIVKSDRAKANGEGIGVVAAEQLHELLEMAGEQRGPGEILVYLQGLVGRDLEKGLHLRGINTGY